mmetsp:Transcript_11806/g.25529  ORF Transcript_11806/g.25529 Transcript_11806/m.25529 type:complete len:216 (-) Transcript_11806:1023-1670(-)
MKTSFSARVFDSSHLHAPMARPAIASRFTCTVSMNLGAHLKRLSSNAASGQASPRAQASESLWVKRSGALLFSGAALYTASLSYWQLERYQWKLGLIEERTKRLEDKPVTITSLLPVGDDNSCFPLPESLEYRKVTKHDQCCRPLAVSSLLACVDRALPNIAAGLRSLHLWCRYFALASSTMRIRSSWVLAPRRLLRDTARLYRLALQVRPGGTW